MNDSIKKLYNGLEYSKLKNNISMLGSTKMTVESFIICRIITTLLVFFISVYLLELGYILTPILSIGWYYLYYYLVITAPIKKRIKKLDKEALHFFEILTLTLESGRNLEKSLEVTCFNLNSELSNDFKKVLFEIKFGKTLNEALENLKQRMPSETINNIILNITQTNIFGNSIIDTMYNQIAFLRDKQVLEIKGEINKIPNKISIISVIFIVPLILLLVLGPFIINYFV